MLQLNSHMASLLIGICSKASNLAKAKEVWHWATEQGITPTVHMYNNMMAVYDKTGLTHQVSAYRTHPLIVLWVAHGCQLE
jgi:hypothetical protein